MFFGPLLLVGLVVLAIWFFQQQQQRHAVGYEPRRGDTRAFEIVRERYARGEISQDEYERMCRDLAESR